MVFLIIIVIAYLLGAIPFGLVITKAAGLKDIRQIGSGNIGATNVLRTGRKDLAAATLLLDSGKGAMAVGLAAAFTGGSQFAMAIAGAMAFLGHCFPIYLKFNGGKGVATFLGTLLALNFAVGAVACVIWAGVAGIFRYSSLAALVAAAIAPFLFLMNVQMAFFLGASAMAAIIFYRHKANILRLLDGTESKIGQKG